MQADGERVRAAHVVIDILPGELTVLKPLPRR